MGASEVLHSTSFIERAEAEAGMELSTVPPGFPRAAEDIAGRFPQQEPASRPARYEAGRFDAKSLAVVIGFHIVAIAMLLTAKAAVQKDAPLPVLHTFDLAAPAPPPAAPPEPAKLAVDPPLTVPKPAVQLVTQSRHILPVAENPVQPVQVAIVAPMEVAAPPSPAPPAPVTPPDFNAAQLNNPAPAYPYPSRKAREEGVALLRVLVTKTGHAGDVRLERTSGFRRLDRAAISTVRKWRFVPARQAGDAVAAWVLVPVTFKLG